MPQIISPYLTHHCMFCVGCVQYVRALRKKSRDQFPFWEVGYVQFRVASLEIGLLAAVLYEVQPVKWLACSAYWHPHKLVIIGKIN